MHGSGLILYCSRIRKNVTNKQTDRDTEKKQRTENSITEATLIPWIAGLSGPILKETYLRYIQEGNIIFQIFCKIKKVTKFLFSVGQALLSRV